MEMTLRATTPTERLYAYAQSTQIAGQCGSPGYLRGCLDDTGTVFLSQWERCVNSLNTPDFKAEFNTVLDMLRFDERYGLALKNRSTMIAFCLAHPQGRFEYNGSEGKQYAFRADTPAHSYFIRCIPDSEEQHLYIYPYRRDWLEQHMKQAEKGIRFITPDYKELFRIPDGDKIRIFTGGGDTRDRICRFIDETHFETSGEYASALYHICEFAERLEKTHGRVVPLRSILPEQCYSLLLDTGKVVILKRGETGYYKTGIPVLDKEDARKLVNEYNAKLGVTAAQAAAMSAGSMFGWATPAADPKNYDDQGRPIKPKHRDRGDAR